MSEQQLYIPANEALAEPDDLSQETKLTSQRHLTRIIFVCLPKRYSENRSNMGLNF